MGTRPTLSRLVVLVILSLAPLLLPLPALGQYMYLDTNGDGVNTAADVVSPTGITTVDVWLRTSADRSGTSVICDTDGSSRMTVNSYEFILRAQGGTVQWGSVTNRFPGTLSLGAGSNATDLHAGYGGTALLAPGTYRLATVTLSVLTGTPVLSIVPSTPLSGLFLTGFGSLCPGLDFDNTLKLGLDWFDVDGAGWGGAGGNRLPTLAPVENMTVSEGEVATQTITATDADNDPVEFGKSAGPSFMTVSTQDPGTGTATGTIRLAPGFSDAGVANGTVFASDGYGRTELSLLIQVLNAPARPVLQPLVNMEIAAGDTASQPISAIDSDRGAALVSFVLVSGPAYVTVSNLGAQDATTALGRVVITPRSADVGSAQVTIAAVKGFQRDEGTFTVTVLPSTSPDRPPQITFIPPVYLAAATTKAINVEARDPDGDVMTARKISGPSYATTSTRVSTPGYLLGAVTLAPAFEDLGSDTLTIGVSDGKLESFVDIAITVLDSQRPVLLGVRDVTVGATLKDGFEIRAINPDMEPVRFFKAAGPGYLTVSPGYPGPTNANAWVSLRPGWEDVGTATGALGVTDGSDTTTAAFEITVLRACPMTLPTLVTSPWAPRRVLAGDLNGDGIPDLVALPGHSNEALVWLGNGDGTFRPSSPVPNVYSNVSTADDLLVDVNSDGRLDLVLANGNAGTVTVRLGRGDGTFGDGISLPSGGSLREPEALAAADMNEDGILDLVVGDSGSNSGLRVMLGRGDGTFALAGAVSFPAWSFRLATADLDRDGHVDVAVAWDYGGGVSVFRGDGAGGLSQSTTWPASGLQQVQSVMAGDLNGDGWSDLAVEGDGVTVLFGDAHGPTGRSVRYSGSYGFGSAAIGDVTGDGRADLVRCGTAGADGKSPWLVYPGTGSDSLGPPTGVPSAFGARYLVTGDLNLDGRLDWVGVREQGIVAVLNLGCGGSEDQPPVVLAPAECSGREGAALAVDVFAADPDAQPILSFTGSPLPQGASFTAATDGASGRLTWTPGFDQAGEYLVTFAAVTSQTGSRATRIRVANTDRPPVVSAPPGKVACAGATISFPVTAGDPDHEPISALTASPIPPGATFSVNPDHTGAVFTWQTTSGNVGSYEIAFVAANAMSDTSYTEIVIGASNSCPIAFALESPDTAGAIRVGCSLALDALNRAHIAYCGDGPIRYAFESGGGWSVESLPQGGSNASVALDGAGVPWIAYRSWAVPGDYPASTTMVAVRDGETWIAESAGPPGTHFTSGLAFALDPAGVPHLAGWRMSEYARVLYATRGPVGWTEETVFYAAEGAYVSSISFDPQGNPHIVGQVFMGGIFHAVKQSGAWTVEKLPAASRVSCALDPQGRPCLATISYDTQRMLQYRTLVDGAWQLETVGPAEQGDSPELSLAVDRNGRPVIAYHNSSGDRLMLAWKDGGTWKTQVVDVGGVGRGPSLALADGLNPRIAYLDYANWDLRFASGQMPPPNRPPVANAGGPYSGTIGARIRFDGTASADPEGAPLDYLWDYGDGVQGAGVQPEHAYATIGAYPVTLHVSDGALTDSARTTATVAGALEARAFLVGSVRSVPMVQTAQPFLIVQLEPIQNAYANTDLDPSSVVMRSDSTGVVNVIPASAGKALQSGDRDRNGVAELQFLFRRQDIADLFGDARGRTHVRATVEGSLRSGAVIRAPLDLVVVATGATLAASVYPNPLNPKGTIDVLTHRPGPLRVLLFDVNGKIVRELVDEHWAPAGFREIPFDARDGDARPLASGVYFYRVESAGERITGRAVIAK